ncbi:MAG: hypothetical protein P8P66_14800 [Paracoccaceae bacterium]|nr:hypothetical protein [Paracoccaceae bacterium]
MATPTQTVSHLTGPYDGWVLETGREYDFARLYSDSYGVGLHLSGVIEGDVDPNAPLMLEHANGQPSTAVAPAIWSAGGPMRSTPVLLSDPMGTTPPEGRTDAGHLGWRPGFPLAAPMNASTTSDVPASAHPAVDPKRLIVIAACIDDGIAFANDRFTSDGLSRVDYCWTMSAAAAENSAVAFGRETTAEQIDDLQSMHQGDEDALYDAAGVLRGGELPRCGLHHPVTHGAHVLDLLTGGETDSNTRIIAVDLPTTATWDTSGFGKDMYVLAAIHYIFERADRIAQAYGQSHLPVVLNISYGTSGGPHDGSAVIEAAMDELIQARRNLAPTALVMPSGNMHLDRLSARITPKHRAAAAALNWRVQPCDGTSSYVEMWFPTGCAPSNFTVAIEGPRGTCSASVTGSTSAQTRPLTVDGKVSGSCEQVRRAVIAVWCTLHWPRPKCPRTTNPPPPRACGKSPSKAPPLAQSKHAFSATSTMAAAALARGKAISTSPITKAMTPLGLRNRRTTTVLCNATDQ